jgi:hypothetical protein
VGKPASACGGILGVRKGAQADGHIGAGMLHVEVFNECLPGFSGRFNRNVGLGSGFRMGNGTGRGVLSALSGGTMVHRISLLQMALMQPLGFLPG